MIKILQLFFVTISILTIKPLFAIHMGHNDFEETVGTNSIQKRKIVVDFNQATPTDLDDQITFGQDELKSKLSARIEASVTIAKFLKSRLEIHFRNIKSEDHLAAACLVMKDLGYGKYLNKEPSILLINDPAADTKVQTSTNNKREEYHGDGLM